MWLGQPPLLTFYPAKVCSRCWVRRPYLVIKNFAHPFQLFLQRLVKPKTWLVDSSYVISSYLDFLYFLLVKSSFTEIVLKIDVGLCSSTSLCNYWVLDVEARVSELLPKKLLRPPKIVFKYYLTCKPMSFFTWLILSSYFVKCLLLHLTKMQHSSEFYISWLIFG